jgi:hypothetical protein
VRVLRREILSISYTATQGSGGGTTVAYTERELHASGGCEAAGAELCGRGIDGRKHQRQHAARGASTNTGTSFGFNGCSAKCDRQHDPDSWEGGAHGKGRSPRATPDASRRRPCCKAVIICWSGSCPDQKVTETLKSRTSRIISLEAFGFSGLVSRGSATGKIDDFSFMLGSRCVPLLSVAGLRRLRRCRKRF